MTDFAANCLHCKNQKIAFETHGAYNYSPDIFIFLECRFCHYPVIGKFFAVGNNWLLTDYQGIKSINFHSLKFIEFVKISDNSECPEHLPDNVAESYRQALDNIGRRNWTAAGTMFRRTLEGAVKKLNQNAKGGLQNKIDELGEKHGITQSMKTWAHEVRVIGNEASHEEEHIDEKDAKDAWNFTENFLIYTFSLPEKIRKRKEDIGRLSKK